MKTQFFILTGLMLCICMVNAGVVPIEPLLETNTTVTFSGTIPTYTQSETADNSTYEKAWKTYSIRSRSPRPTYAIVHLEGTASIDCTKTAQGMTILSKHTVESDALPYGEYDYSGKVNALTQIQSGYFWIGSSAACPPSSLVWLDIKLEFKNGGKPEASNWDFKLFYGNNWVLINKAYLESHNYQASVMLRTQQGYGVTLTHETWTFNHPLSTECKVTFDTRIPEPAMMVLLGLGTLLCRQRKAFGRYGTR